MSIVISEKVLQLAVVLIDWQSPEVVRFILVLGQYHFSLLYSFLIIVLVDRCLLLLHL